MYCGNECRGIMVALDRRQKNRERHSYEQSIPTRFAAWIREFEQRVRKHAPETAVGYQAGLWTGSSYFWLPTVLAGTTKNGKPNTRLTFHRKRTRDEFFLIYPFEPPVVPVSTIYQIRFVSRLYPHPHIDDMGSFSEVIPYEMKIGNLPIDSPGTLPVSRNKR